MTIFWGGPPFGHSILNLTFLPPRKNHSTFSIYLFIEVVCFCDKHPKSLDEHMFLKISFFHTALVCTVKTIGIESTYSLSGLQLRVDWDRIKNLVLQIYDI